ncbi:RrF2 family transcriptional regulator [Undibacterium terreum]|uniref:HTH-type transcriptional regulator NsrR n=1 Tax=Undibacterium terreum TaxID=1224302 RepID=A0A916U1U2_9BURK|nr:Rrf2 family transcriptional regulator [Undibacterium terreum]GGC57537.1 HTH-type transcriptional regulator NsrR [Undibacterium terreum]
MRLTAFTDYTLRTLMYLAIHRDKLATVHDIAELHHISQNHLTKVVHQLGLTGVIETVRGRNGGFRLNKEPADINIGEVVRSSESDFFMAECFDEENDTCIYSPACMLKGVLSDATSAYLAVLDKVTLEQLVQKSGGRGKKDPAGAVKIRFQR